MALMLAAISGTGTKRIMRRLITSGASYEHHFTAASHSLLALPCLLVSLSPTINGQGARNESTIAFDGGRRRCEQQSMKLKHTVCTAVQYSRTSTADTTPVWLGGCEQLIVHKRYNGLCIQAIIPAYKQRRPNIVVGLKALLHRSMEPTLLMTLWVVCQQDRRKWNSDTALSILKSCARIFWPA